MSLVVKDQVGRRNKHQIIVNISTRSRRTVVGYIRFGSKNLIFVLFLFFIVVYLLLIVLNINNYPLHIDISALNHHQTLSHNNKVRILISGFGHSGTTYLQQFIGEVILDKNETFYLFEATSLFSLKYFGSFYNISTKHKYLNDDNVRSEILTDLYQCKFYEHINYNKFSHKDIIININQLSNSSGLTFASLQQKCLSSKYLIFKEIDYHSYEFSYDYLLRNIPNLIIISLIRNPLTHILSFKRMWNPDKRNINSQMELIEYCVNLICHQQLNDLKYAFKNWNNHNILKMETMFAHTHGNMSVMGTIQHVYTMIFNVPISVTELEKMTVKYNWMRNNFWHYVENQHGQYPQIPTQISYIKENCIKFMEFANYSQSNI